MNNPIINGVLIVSVLAYLIHGFNRFTDKKTYFPKTMTNTMQIDWILDAWKEIFFWPVIVVNGWCKSLRKKTKSHR